MTAPKRIQRKRSKGWRMPEGAVYVGRPSKWGNPFKAGSVMFLTGLKAGERADTGDVVRMYRNALTGKSPAAASARERVQRELAGKDLACWCPLDQPCHADVLLEIANGDGS